MRDSKQLAQVGARVLNGSGGDVSQATEFEQRLAQCLDWAVRAAMTEVLQHVKDNRLVERRMVEGAAAAAVRDFLRQRELE